MSPRDPRIAAHFPWLAARGEDIVLKTPGDQRRSWCHIEDAARAILTILDKGLPGELYTVADESSELTVREFAERIAAAGRVEVRFAPATPAEENLFNPMPSAVFDSGKLRSLGWKARHAIEEGLASCVMPTLTDV
jgi:nucleoside-diphosphate-sugar epimerase